MQHKISKEFSFSLDIYLRVWISIPLKKKNQTNSESRGGYEKRKIFSYLKGEHPEISLPAPAKAVAELVLLNNLSMTF